MRAARPKATEKGLLLQVLPAIRCIHQTVELDERGTELMAM
jgi:hypothetical protein